mgnify:CR=1 FL=1
MPIEILRNPLLEVAQALSDGIVGFNRTTIPNLERNEDEVRFHVIAKDNLGELVGGLRGACYWNTLHIELLWLSDAARGSGIGRTIIAAAEDYAEDQGCELALVETTSWQARPFYEKNGYELMATLEGRPKGHASHYLSKTLASTKP